MRLAVLALALSSPAAIGAAPAPGEAGSAAAPVPALPAAWDRASGEALLAVLGSAPRHGLDATDYAYDALLQQVAAAGERLPPDLAQALQRALYYYARDLHGGRVDPAAVDPEWRHPRGILEPAALPRPPFDRAALEAALAGLAPRHAAYAALQWALADYRARAAHGGWPTPGDGPWLREGDRHPNVARMRERLAAEDPDLPHNADPEQFDANLAAALRRFQARHGLKRDAIVGPDTRRALNVTVAARVAQLSANLERWRWLPGEFGDDYLLVNIASQELTLVRGGLPIYHARAVVGRASRRSPAFASRVTHVVFNPSWTVPYRLATRDLLPKQQADPGYFAAKRIRVFDRGNGGVEVDAAAIDWQTIGRRNFPYVLRQEPGPANSLGRLKFQLPNRFSIYLHDTPERELFDAPSRAFSSGCIRVERPQELARLLFDAPGQWDASAIGKAIDNAATRHVALPRPVPIHLVYLTAWVAADGSTQFGDDIYGLDAPLLRALYQEVPELPPPLPDAAHPDSDGVPSP